MNNRDADASDDQNDDSSREEADKNSLDVDYGTDSSNAEEVDDGDSTPDDVGDEEDEASDNDSIILRRIAAAALVLISIVFVTVFVLNPTRLSFLMATVTTVAALLLTPLLTRQVTREEATANAEGRIGKPLRANSRVERVLMKHEQLRFETRFHPIITIQWWALIAASLTIFIIVEILFDAPPWSWTLIGWLFILFVLIYRAKEEYDVAARARRENRKSNPPPLIKIFPRLIIILAWIVPGIYTPMVIGLDAFFWSYVGIVLINLPFVYKLVEWWVNVFGVTDRRLVTVTGLLYNEVSQMPIKAVTDMKYTESMVSVQLARLRWIRAPYGEFIVESAGQNQALNVISPVPDGPTAYQNINYLGLPVSKPESKEDAKSPNRRRDR